MTKSLSHIPPKPSLYCSLFYSQLMTVIQAKNLGVILDSSFSHIPYSIHWYIFHPDSSIFKTYLNLTTHQHTSYYSPSPNHHHFLLGIKSGLASSLLPLHIFNLWKVTPCSLLQLPKHSESLHFAIYTTWLSSSSSFFF